MTGLTQILRDGLRLEVLVTAEDIDVVQLIPLLDHSSYVFAELGDLDVVTTLVVDGQRDAGLLAVDGEFLQLDGACRARFLD